MRGIREREAGQALVLFVCSLVMLLGFGALVIDQGCWITWRSELQRGADAGALAAGAELLTGDPIAAAIDIAGKNTVAGQGLTLNPYQVLLGWYDAEHDSFRVTRNIDYSNSVAVVALRSDSSPEGPLASYFAKAFGINSMQMAALAIAYADPAISGFTGGDGTPLVPFLVDAETFGGISGGVINAPVGDEVSFFPSADGVPGNFGLADIDGDGNSAAELDDWIRNGYPCDIEIPEGADGLMVAGSPGFKVSIKSAVQSRMGDTVIVMVYDQVTEQGSLSLFRVKSFMAIELTSIRITGGGSRRYIKGRVREMVSSFATTGSQTAVVNDSLGSVRLVR